MTHPDELSRLREEEIARAICKADGFDPDGLHVDDRITQPNWKIYAVNARAVIALLLPEITTLRTALSSAEADVTRAHVENAELREALERLQRFKQSGAMDIVFRNNACELAYLEAHDAAADRLHAAAKTLWDVHCKTHDERKHPDRGLNPTKYAMNYGELVALKEAIDAYEAAI